MRNMVVVHHQGGSISKGYTNDLNPSNDRFHIADKDTGEISEISLYDLKAVFFVKSFEGFPDYQEKHDVERTGLGKKIKIRFADGETIIG